MPANYSEQRLIPHLVLLSQNDLADEGAAYEALSRLFYDNDTPASIVRLSDGQGLMVVDWDHQNRNRAIH